MDRHDHGGTSTQRPLVSRRGFLSSAGRMGLATGVAAGLSACSGLSAQSSASQDANSKLYPLNEAERLAHNLKWPRSSIRDPEQKVQITIAHAWDADFWPRQIQFDKFFMKRHPNIEVLTENTSWGDYLQKYVIQASGGSLPDIMYCQYAWSQFFIQADTFVPLDDYIAREPDFDRADFTAPSLGYYERGGKLFGLSYDCGPIMLFYNKDIFDKAHVPYPTSNWKFDDLKRAARRLTHGTGANKTFGFATFPQVSNDMSPAYLQPFGAHFLNGTETECLIDQQKAIKAIEWWADAMRPASPSLGDAQALNAGAFLMGRAAMDAQGSWGAPTLIAQADFRWAVADWPAGPESHSTAAEGSCYAITQHSKQRDAAWIYLQEMTSTAGLTFLFASTGRGSPGRKSAWPAYLKSKYAPDGADHFYRALNSYATNEGVLYQGTNQKVVDAATPVWDRIHSGKLTVSQGLDQVRSRVQPILLQNRG